MLKGRRQCQLIEYEEKQREKNREIENNEEEIENNEDVESTKHICMVIRRPQYGKTSICMETIKRQKNNVIHIILTMNTIKSNNQFFDRCNIVFGEEKICIFNSQSMKKKKNAKTVSDVKKQILKEKKTIIIACAHPKRFKNSIGDLLDELEDSKAFYNKKVCIHIDEIHAYIKSNRKYIEGWNTKEIVQQNTGYTGTHFSVWGEGIWNELFIVDCKNFDIGTEEYFGVKDAQHIIFSNIDEKCVDPEIPSSILDLSSVSGSNNQKWFTKGNTCFDMGDELSFLRYVKSVLIHWKNKDTIKQDNFSYNFIPGYKRKYTHLKIYEIISELFPESITIIYNSDKIHGNKYYKNKRWGPVPDKMETFEQILELKNKYPNNPFFVTGFINVNMSITLICPELGNFDNVIFSHKHYSNNQPDILYQMCRYVFRYSHWPEQYKKQIKRTKLWSDNQKVINVCLNYEKDVTMAEKMGGSLRTFEELTDNDYFKKKKRLPISHTHNDISQYVLYHNTLEFPVYDKSMEESMWKHVKGQYQKHRGIDISIKSIPKRNENGFYEVSTTGKKEVYTKDIIDKIIKGFSWHSNFALTKGCFKYARIYVGYQNNDNPFNYTIYLRLMTLKECEEVTKHFENLS